MNQDNDADIFDPFLSLVKSSQYFDQEDILCVEETRTEHQKHVNTRIEMDKALLDTKQYLQNRLQVLQQFEQTVPEKTRTSPAYKHFFETFLQKQVMIKKKYNELLEKREAIYGKYYSPPASPHQDPSASLLTSISPSDLSDMPDFSSTKSFSKESASPVLPSSESEAGT